MKSAITHRTLAVAIVVVACFAAPLGYAQKAALVKNFDEKGRSPYMELVSCLHASSCQAVAAAVPTGKRLVIEHISAQISALKPGNFSLLGIVLNPGLTVAFLPATFIYSDSANNFWALNDTTLVYVEAGAKPAVELFGTTNDTVSLFAVLSGYFVDLGN